MAPFGGPGRSRPRFGCCGAAVVLPSDSRSRERVDSAAGWPHGVCSAPPYRGAAGASRLCRVGRSDSERRARDALPVRASRPRVLVRCNRRFEPSPVTVASLQPVVLSRRNTIPFEHGAVATLDVVAILFVVSILFGPIIPNNS